MKMPDLPDPARGLSGLADAAAKAVGDAAGAAGKATQSVSSAPPDALAEATDSLLDAMNSGASRLLQDGSAVAARLAALPPDLQGPMASLSTALDACAGAVKESVPSDRLAQFAQDALDATAKTLGPARSWANKMEGKLQGVSQVVQRVFDWVEKIVQKVTGLAAPAGRLAMVAISSAVSVVGAVAAVATGSAGTGAATRAAEWMAGKAAVVVSWVANAVGLGPELVPRITGVVTRVADVTERAGSWLLGTASKGIEDASRKGTGMGIGLSKLMESAMSDASSTMRVIMDSKNQTVDSVVRMMEAMFAAQLKLQSAVAQR